MPENTDNGKARTKASQTSQTNWRSWLDRQQLRAQARLDTQSADSVIPWLFVAVLFAALEWVALARFWGFDHGVNLAAAVQSTWLIGEGYIPESSLLGENYLAAQASFIIYPLAQLANLFPTAQALLTIQAAALSLGLVPLWKLARQEATLGIGPSVVLAFAYSVSATVHNLNLAGFHPETLALPALLAMVLHTRLRRRHPGSQLESVSVRPISTAVSAGEVPFANWRRWWTITPLEQTTLGRADLAWLWFFVAVALLSRADLGLAIAGYGVFVVVEGRKLLGWLLASVGMAWLLLAAWVIQPALSDGQYLYSQSFSDYGTGNPLSVFWGILTHPGDFVQDIWTQGNFTAVVMLLAPLVFMPLVAYRYLMPVVPLYVLYLVADVPEGESVAQNIPVVAFVFVAAAFALKRSGQVLVERVRVNRQVIFALALAAAVFYVNDAGTSPYNSPWNWQNQEAQAQVHEVATDLVPGDAVVRASPSFLPGLAERVGVFELDTTGSQSREAAERAMVGADWILLDTEQAPVWGGQLLEVQRFSTVLRQNGYELEFGRADTLVFRYVG